ncbi:unnamed protein product [Rhodiola kirilowii]
MNDKVGIEIERTDLGKNRIRVYSIFNISLQGRKEGKAVLK